MRAFKLSEGVIRTLVLSFAISLTMNCYLVMILTLVKGHNQVVMYTIFGIESVMICWLLRSSLKETCFAIIRSEVRLIREMYQTDNGRNTIVSVGMIVFSVTGLLVLLYCILVVKNTFVPIFNIWDDIVSWNRWAVAWYNGRFPSFTMNYPQLIPTAWSTVYTFLGTSQIQGFAKAIMPCFTILLVLAIADIGYRTRNFGYVIAVSTTGFLLLSVMGLHHVTSGYVDIPVAFMSFIPVYLLLTCGAGSFVKLRKTLWLGATLVVGAGMTKQAGVFLALVYPLLCYLLVLRQLPDITKKDLASFLTWTYVMIFALLLPWYGFAQYRILRGVDQSEVEIVTNTIHGGRTLWQRLVLAVSKLTDSLGSFPLFTSILGKVTGNSVVAKKALLAVVIATAAASAMNRTWRVLLVVVLLPYFFIWAFFFSYDLRNFSVAIPFLGASMGCGIVTIRRQFSDLVTKLASLPAWLIIAVAAVTVGYLGFSFDGNGYVDREKMLRRQIGIPAANEVLFNFGRAHSFEGNILTNYHIMHYLPGLENLYRCCGFVSVKEIAGHLKSGKVGYIFMLQMLNEKPPQEVNDYFAAKIKSGELESLPSGEHMVFLQVKRSQ